MKKPRVTLTVEGTSYVPVRAIELERLRAVEKAARAVVNGSQFMKLRQATVAGAALRKLAETVRQ